MKPLVLIANSNEALLYDSIRFLSEHGYCVDTAVSANECVGRLREAPPDILVLDMDLLDGGGAEVLSIMTTNSGIASPLAMLVTGDPGAAFMQPDHLPAFLRIIPKPYDLANIMNALLGEFNDYWLDRQITAINELQAESKLSDTSMIGTPNNDPTECRSRNKAHPGSRVDVISGNHRFDPPFDDHRPTRTPDYSRAFGFATAHR